MPVGDVSEGKKGRTEVSDLKKVHNLRSHPRHAFLDTGFYDSASWLGVLEDTPFGSAYYFDGGRE